VIRRVPWVSSKGIGVLDDPSLTLESVHFDSSIDADAPPLEGLDPTDDSDTEITVTAAAVG